MYLGELSLVLTAAVTTGPSSVVVTSSWLLDEASDQQTSQEEAWIDLAHIDAWTPEIQVQHSRRIKNSPHCIITSCNNF